MTLLRGRSSLLVASLAALCALAGCSKSADAPEQAAQENSGGVFSKMMESSRPTVVPAGTSLRVVLDQSISSRDAHSGDAFSATLVEPVVIDGKTVIPRDARARGHVVEAQASGRLSTPASLSLALDAVEVGGKYYDIETSAISQRGSSHKKRDAEFIGGGAALGALIGGLAGHGKGAAIGAAAGAGAGTAGAAATGKKDITVPAESALAFRLRQSLTVAIKS